MVDLQETIGTVLVPTSLQVEGMSCKWRYPIIQGEIPLWLAFEVKPP
jgi:hypothetical protein